MTQELEGELRPASQQPQVKISTIISTYCEALATCIETLLPLCMFYMFRRIC